jgi:hypothetical protein
MANSRYNRMSLSATLSNPLLRHLLKHGTFLCRSQPTDGASTNTSATCRYGHYEHTPTSRVEAPSVGCERHRKVPLARGLAKRNVEESMGGTPYGQVADYFARFDHGH